ncbi:unnamed protein product [Penicillium discolor]
MDPPAGALVTVFLPDAPGRLGDRLAEMAAVDDGLAIRRTRYQFGLVPKPANVRDFLSFSRDLRSLHPDAVLYHLYASALATRMALLGRRTRTVHMVAGPLHLETPVIRLAERVLHHADDVIVCGSDDTLRRYAEVVPGADKLVSIPYGVDTRVFMPPRGGDRPVAAEAHRPGSTFEVIMVAFVYAPKRLVHRGHGIKGHAELLQAWAAFVRDHDDAHLTIVGGGFRPEGEVYRRQLIEALPRSLEELRVTWLDTVDDVRAAYSAADVSVSPSLSENHGAALEASAMAVPSIVSDAGGLPETMAPGATGWVIPAGDPDALRDALEEAYRAWRDDRLSAMGDAARARAVELFDSTDAAARVAHVVLDGARR